MSQNQSGFKPRDSCFNQLLSITHDIYKSSDVGLKVRAVFLDISKAFDEVWRDGLILKLKQAGFSGALLRFLIFVQLEIKSNTKRSKFFMDRC